MRGPKTTLENYTPALAIALFAMCKVAEFLVDEIEAPVDPISPRGIEKINKVKVCREQIKNSKELIDHFLGSKQ